MAEQTRIEQLNAGLQNLVSSSSTATNALNELNDTVLNSGKGMEALADSINKSFLSVKQLANGIGGVVGSVPGLGIVGTAFGGLGDIIGKVGGATKLLTDGFINAVRGVDALTQVNRTLTNDNYKLAAQFGQTLDEAEKFTEFMLGSAEQLASADFGYQNFATESRAMVRALGEQRLSFDVMSDTIQTSTGSINLYSAAVLQANALGLEFRDYAGIMSQLMLGQGMSTQEAAETLSIYGDLAADTGLTVSKISESLTGLGNSFRKMGLDATFGESFLRGFSEALKDTGIGIDAVAEMTQVFGQRMAALSTNYGSAFITAMRGGLDMGSGGALGAGIQLQAKLMDQGTDQAQLGADIARAVRDTIASFTGGKIVTVQEAAQSGDPRMEQAYYAQTKLLERMYGISDASEQARTLELLQRMADAQTTGSVEAMESISQDLQKALGLREATLSNEEKLNATVLAQLAQLQEQTRLMRLIAQVGQGTLVEPTSGLIESGFENIFSAVPTIEKQLEEYANAIKEGDFDRGAGEKLIKQIAEAKMPEPSEPKIDQTVEFLKTGVLNINTKKLEEVIIEQLPAKLAEILSSVLPKSSGGSGDTPGKVGR